MVVIGLEAHQVEKGIVCELFLGFEHLKPDGHAWGGRGGGGGGGTALGDETQQQASENGEGLSFHGDIVRKNGVKSKRSIAPMVDV